MNESNAQLIRFAKAVLAILRQSSDSEPDISQVYEAAQRCNLDTRHHSGDGE